MSKKKGALVAQKSLNIHLTGLEVEDIIKITLETMTCDSLANILTRQFLNVTIITSCAFMYIMADVKYNHEMQNINSMCHSSYVT